MITRGSREPHPHHHPLNGKKLKKIILYPWTNDANQRSKAAYMGSWELPCLLEMMTSQEDADASLPMDSFQLCQFFAKIPPPQKKKKHISDRTCLSEFQNLSSQICLSLHRCSCSCVVCLFTLFSRYSVTCVWFHSLKKEMFKKEFYISSW